MHRRLSIALFVSLAVLLCAASAQAQTQTPTVALPGHVAQGIAAAASAERAQRAAMAAAAKIARERPAASAPGSAGSGNQAVGKVVQAASSVPVTGEVQSHKVVVDDRGRETLMPAAGLLRGDVIQFTGIFTNRNAIGIRFDPRLSVPSETVLIPGSIQPSSGQVSTVNGVQMVGWSVPNLPPNTQVRASLRVRYEGPAAVPSATAASAPAASAPAASAPAASAQTPAPATPTKAPIAAEPSSAAASAPEQ